MNQKHSKERCSGGTLEQRQSTTVTADHADGLMERGAIPPKSLHDFENVAGRHGRFSPCVSMRDFFQDRNKLIRMIKRWTLVLGFGWSSFLSGSPSQRV